jgi:hypothetical protein
MELILPRYHASVNLATDLDEKYRISERTVFREFLQKFITLDRRGAVPYPAFAGSANAVPSTSLCPARARP